MLGEYDVFLLGDSGYPCWKFFMTPYNAPNISAHKKYNDTFCRASIVIECTFGILKRFYHTTTSKDHGWHFGEHHMILDTYKKNGIIIDEESTTPSMLIHTYHWKEETS
ncbi:hypothetical protein CHS0354_014381 [Potamilus streckersoni]|uniref:DDE Tnp4 domain-containing protein n=1 Tax=Potamilus streckersoni TaxID=2493646 RepID=A0AAE0TEZ3_9BIVA|nr:hypothetical protein CHS0354_014381 [Potamilus streckersoni]